MIAARTTIRPLISTVIATATIVIASIAFQANSVASSDAEALSTEERARLERQLAIAREERDAVVLETEARIAELTETLETERADMAALRDELEATKTALVEAEAGGEDRERLQQQLAIAREERDALALETEALKAEHAKMTTLHDELEAAESAQADAEAQIAELTETLETERADMATLRDELEATESALAKAEAKAEAEAEAELESESESESKTESEANRSANRGLSQEDAAEIGGQLTDKGILVDLDSDELSFASDSAILPTTNLPTLDRVAAWLEDRPELSVRIEGHTDSLGSPEINQPLSLQRAEAVRQALIERGLAAERVVAHGAGSTQPIADNATAAGRRQNRRVEIYLM